MSDDEWWPAYLPPTAPTPAEPLFEFARGSDQAPMSCELKFCGESYGWQAAFYVRGEFFASHGAFPLRAAAIQWAERERAAFERRSGS